MDRNGEFQLEFTLANIRSVYEHKFRVNQSIFNNAPKFGKMETSYYSFGGYDWSLSIYPSGKSESQLGNYFAHYTYFFYSTILLVFEHTAVRHHSIQEISHFLISSFLMISKY